MAKKTPYIVNEKGQRICGAKTKSGEPCGQRPMANGRCWLHGGKSPSGFASASFKTGRYSKVLPVRLWKGYEESYKDPELLTMKAEIAAIDARVGELFGRVDSGESGSLWSKLKGVHNGLIKATNEGDALALRLALNEIEMLINRGLGDYGAWSDIVRLWNVRKGFVESERKRLLDMEQMLSTQQAMVLLAAVVDTIKRNVTDKGALAAITADLARLMTIQAAQRIEG